MIQRREAISGDRARLIAPLIVILLGVAAYSNSLTGPFLFDDKAAIVLNPQIRSVNPFQIPPAGPSTIAGRPVLIFTFGVNYAIGRLHAGGYHFTNLLIHLLCGVLLYAIMRRTLLERSVWGDHPARSATWIAAAVASTWVVHPLNTQAVTFVAQRAESLAGFFLLASLYCFIRSAQSTKWWGIGAVIFCALGMGTKEIVAALPIIVLMYDRTFLAGSFKEAIRRRWVIYFGLIAGYGMILNSLHTGMRGTMVGIHLGVSSLDYARTELNVIAHYVALAFWPANLALDYYDWPIARHWSDVSWQGWMVLAAVIACAAALRFKPWLGFLGIWFFAILAPTSSFLPIMDEAAAEQRMYLPLMAIVAFVIVAGCVALESSRAGRRIAVVVLLLIIGALGWATFQRNTLYQSAIDIWTDTVFKRPDNTRAHVNLGEALAQASIEFPAESPEAIGAAHEAAEQFEWVIAKDPRVTHAIFALGESLVHMGDTAGAETLYTQQLPLHPEVAADLLVERGALRARREDWDEAKADFEAAIAAKPGDIDAHYFLGILNEQRGDLEGAKIELEKVVRINPRYKDASEQVRKIGAMLSSTTKN